MRIIDDLAQRLGVEIGDIEKVPGAAALRSLSQKLGSLLEHQRTSRATRESARDSICTRLGDFLIGGNQGWKNADAVVAGADDQQLLAGGRLDDL